MLSIMVRCGTKPRESVRSSPRFFAERSKERDFATSSRSYTSTIFRYGVTMLRANCARREEIKLVWVELGRFIGSIRVSLAAGEAVVAPR